MSVNLDKEILTLRDCAGVLERHGDEPAWLAAVRTILLGVGAALDDAVNASKVQPQAPAVVVPQVYLIPHNGGPDTMPDDEGQRVRVFYRSENVAAVAGRAGDFDWAHRGKPSDIVAWTPVCEKEAES